MAKRGSTCLVVSSGSRGLWILESTPVLGNLFLLSYVNHAPDAMTIADRDAVSGGIGAAHRRRRQAG
jgi:hypothetical protein